MNTPSSFVGWFRVEAILPELVAVDRGEVLPELVSGAIEAGVLPRARRDEVLQALEAREERGTTALGGGIAIPHAKIKGLRKQVGLIARSHQGVDFRAIDGEAVHVFVMLVSPEARAEEHLAVLRSISSFARDPDFVSFIRQARDAHGILDVLLERSGPGA